ncbi:outer membrane efflux protein [Nautilia profundicola AmH]|uniref:Outer membrane efflux protein n=1 Tax=Nautilia profundicola (strain ATCC BAA-1463 / DSM 18972 / AmH) TaxID=598659 RepID=B9L644_NAUPA|nr:TolC family protein [Nautilia profundicola]ACM93686.1 outer membrane efflux protein [Nautilia profundicola AmH]
MNKFLLISAALSSLLMAKTVNFDTVLNESLSNNLELKAKKLNIDKAKADLKTAKGYDLGKLIFTEEISRSNNALYVFGMKLESREATFKDFGFSDFLMAWGSGATPDQLLAIQPKDLNYPGARSNFKTKFVYEVPIFTGFKLKYAKEMAKLQVIANKFKYANDKNRLAIEVLKAYNGAVAAKYFISALKKAKETTASFVKMIENFKKVGMATDTDLLQAKKRDSEVDAMLTEAKNKYALALSYLRFLSGDDEISDVGDFKVIVSPDSDLKDLKKAALKNRNDLKWMQKNVETMQKKVKMDSSVKYPMIGAHLEYGWNDNQLNNIDSDKDYFVAAVGLNYTIFDNSEKAKIEKSKIEAMQTAYYYKYMKKGIALQVEQKYLDLQAKAAVLKNKIVNKDLAEEILNKYTYMYKQGMINMTILLMKEADARKARAELIKAKYDEALAAAELKAAIGDLVKESK